MSVKRMRPSGHPEPIYPVGVSDEYGSIEYYDEEDLPQVLQKWTSSEIHILKPPCDYPHEALLIKILENMPSTVSKFVVRFDGGSDLDSVFYLEDKCFKVLAFCTSKFWYLPFFKERIECIKFNRNSLTENEFNTMCEGIKQSNLDIQHTFMDHDAFFHLK